MPLTVGLCLYTGRNFTGRLWYSFAEEGFTYHAIHEHILMHERLWGEVRSLHAYPPQTVDNLTGRIFLIYWSRIANHDSYYGNLLQLRIIGEDRYPIANLEEKFGPHMDLISALLVTHRTKSSNIHHIGVLGSSLERTISREIDELINNIDEFDRTGTSIRWAPQGGSHWENFRNLIEISFSLRFDATTVWIFFDPDAEIVIRTLLDFVDGEFVLDSFRVYAWGGDITDTIENIVREIFACRVPQIIEGINNQIRRIISSYNITDTFLLPGNMLDYRQDSLNIPRVPPEWEIRFLDDQQEVDSDTFDFTLVFEFEI